MDKYTYAVTRVECPKPGCKNAAVGQKCTGTSAVVHPERRKKAIAEGYWDVQKAWDGEYGQLSGCPLEALRE